MNLWTICLIFWRMWTTAPTCSGSCNQGRQPCDCRNTASPCTSGRTGETER